ncbi:MAG: hypothetical protein FWE40_05145 [Oscillospiraceae bacterium]|nr:hypothetical protein [Oscillospiraceae bacterium]
MKLVTEAELRALCLPDGMLLRLPMGQQLSPAAQEYCAQRGITVVFQKPEHMTHLNKTQLVPKTHQRIALRGKLDSLQALLLQCIAQARQCNRQDCAAGLQDCFDLAQAIMAAEVKEQPLPPPALLGLTSAGLRAQSHEHYVAPHADMSALCLALNVVRTQVRETELAACAIARDDLIEALNRMSSAVYLLFLREIG